MSRYWWERTRTVANTEIVIKLSKGAAVAWVLGEAVLSAAVVLGGGLLFAWAVFGWVLRPWEFVVDLSAVFVAVYFCVRVEGIRRDNGSAH